MRGGERGRLVRRRAQRMLTDQAAKSCLDREMHKRGVFLGVEKPARAPVPMELKRISIERKVLVPPFARERKLFVRIERLPVCSFARSQRFLDSCATIFRSSVTWLASLYPTSDTNAGVETQYASTLHFFGPFREQQTKRHCRGSRHRRGPCCAPCTVASRLHRLSARDPTISYFRP